MDGRGCACWGICAPAVGLCAPAGGLCAPAGGLCAPAGGLCAPAVGKVCGAGWVVGGGRAGGGRRAGGRREVHGKSWAPAHHPHPPTHTHTHTHTPKIAIPRCGRIITRCIKMCKLPSTGLYMCLPTPSACHRQARTAQGRTRQCRPVPARACPHLLDPAKAFQGLPGSLTGRNSGSRQHRFGHERSQEVNPRAHVNSPSAASGGFWKP